MSSLVELEEQLACAERDCEDKMDEYENIVWSLLSSFDTAVGFTRALGSMGSNARLKALDTHMGSGRDVHVIACKNHAPPNAERFDRLSQEMTNKSEELVDLLTKLNSEEIKNELEQYRAKLKDCRAKKNQKQQELNTLKHHLQGEKWKDISIMDTMKEALEELSATIAREEQEHQKDSSASDPADEVDYGSLAFLFKLRD